MLVSVEKSWNKNQSIKKRDIPIVYNKKKANMEILYQRIGKLVLENLVNE